jgi:hypothetical protein
MNKKAAMGESIQMVYRLFLILVIAFIILGTSAVVLGVYINIRDAEARILASQVLDCLDKDGKINLDLISKDFQNKILDYCKINGTERVFVKIDFLNNEASFAVLQHGDSGKKTIKSILDKNKDSKNLKIYEPGYFLMNFNYPALLNGNLVNCNIKMEVIVLDEETI